MVFRTGSRGGMVRLFLLLQRGRVGSAHHPLASISAANADRRVSVSQSRRLPSALDRLRGQSAEKEALFGGASLGAHGAGGRGEAMPADIDP